MNFEQLRIFISVVDCKSFTKAAEMLYISHSTTSRNVAGLEEDMGVKLLLRDNRSVRLTAAGEILYREGAKLLRKIDSIGNAVRGAGFGLSGRLSVASANLYSHKLYGGYRDFCGRYPDVVLSIYHRDIPEIWRQVSSGAADVGVTFSYTLPEETSDCEVHIIASEKFCVIAPPEHSLASRGAIKISELQAIGYASMAAPKPDILRKLDEKSNLPAFSGGYTAAPTIEALFLQVRMGGGVSMVPYPLVKEYGEGCAVVDIEDMDASFDVVALWRRDNLNPSLPLFAETILNRSR